MNSFSSHASIFESEISDGVVHEGGKDPFEKKTFPFHQYDVSGVFEGFEDPFYTRFKIPDD